MSQKIVTELPTEAAYSQWAEFYDFDRNPCRDLDAATLRSTVLPLEGSDIVELGAGTGKNTNHLARHASTVIAMDQSEEMLKRARLIRPASNVILVRADIRRPWPIPNCSVDGVVANLVLEHIRHLDHIFDEAARILRPGGFVFISELHPFRQLQGSQARYQIEGEQFRIEAYYHSFESYITAGLGAGLAITSVRERLEEDAGVPAPGNPPRLLQLVFQL